jgi:hypothetical protein
MSDQHLRELERRALDGSVETRTALLRERMRAGTISNTRLGFASYLGDEASRLAVVGLFTVTHWKAFDDLAKRNFQDWLIRTTGFIPSDRQRCWYLARMAVAAAKPILPNWVTAQVRRRHGKALEEVFESAEAWLADPNEYAWRRVPRGDGSWSWESPTAGRGWLRL